MLIREYTPADLDALRRMHASQGFDYAFPDLADPIFISKLILEDDSGRPVMAALARLTCEMYLLVDRAADASCGVRELAPAVCRPGLPGSAPRTQSQSAPSQASHNNNSRAPDSRARAGNARTRWTQLLALHRAGELDLLARGLDDAHAWLPPQIARRFGRRLESLGWLRDDSWTPYCKRLKTSG